MGIGSVSRLLFPLPSANGRERHFFLQESLLAQAGSFAGNQAPDLLSFCIVVPRESEQGEGIWSETCRVAVVACRTACCRL